MKFDINEQLRKYETPIKQVLNDNLMHFVKFYIASPEKDMKMATDIVIKVTGGDVALRIREDDCKYRDFTIRSKSKYGGRTEITKLKEGFGRWYLYAWANKEAGFDDWLLVDLDILRESHLLNEDYKSIPNGDGTEFIAIPQEDLKMYDCIIAYKNQTRGRAERERV